MPATLDQLLALPLGARVQVARKSDLWNTDGKMDYLLGAVLTRAICVNPDDGHFTVIGDTALVSRKEFGAGTWMLRPEELDILDTHSGPTKAKDGTHNTPKSALLQKAKSKALTAVMPMV